MRSKYKNGTEPKLWAKIIIYLVCILGALICLLPLLNVLAISFSTKDFASQTFLFPIEWSLESYQVIFSQNQVWTSIGISIIRVVYAVALSTALTVLMGYPLSKSNAEYPTRKLYVAVLIVCMLFDGGMAPKVILMLNWLKLGNTISAIVLPLAVNIFNVILVMNFFRQLPKEVEEAASVDGANKFQIISRIVVPMSKPVIATIMMFTFVNHWNDWFTALVYMSDMTKWPFQTYIRTTIKADDIRSLIDLTNYLMVSDKTIKAAQIIVGIIPLLIMYPLVQKYFAAGINLGAVKG